MPIKKEKSKILQKAEKYYGRKRRAACSRAGSDLALIGTSSSGAYLGSSHCKAKHSKKRKGSKKRK